MNSSASFRALLEALRRERQSAATQLFLRFAPPLRVLARQRLGRLLARKEDPDDVLQSVFRSFFVRYRAGQLMLSTWEGLAALLSVITARKCDNRRRYFDAACRRVTSEVEPGSGDGERLATLAVAPGPSPSAALAVGSAWAAVLRCLTPRDRAILDAHLRGESVAEIAQSLGRSRRTVQRALEQIEFRVVRQLGAGVFPSS